jgi:two-component system phosphate regulon response regulator PhoB
MMPTVVWKRKMRSMPQLSILVVSDDISLVQSVSQSLSSAGYQSVHLPSGSPVLKYVQAHVPALVIVNVPVGGTAEIGLCKQLKHDALTATLPLILLTDSREETSLIVGLTIGVDGYLIKPFSSRLLLALVQAILRRTQPHLEGENAGGFELGALRIHPGRHEVYVNGRQVRLTPTEFRLLFLLAQPPEQTWSRPQIVNTVRGEQANVTLRSVDAHIAALRRKLGPYGRRIQTVRSVGYRLQHAEDSLRSVIPPTC